MDKQESSLRIVEHPILGKIEERKKVHIYIDGRKIPAYEGENIAAALTAAGIQVFRTTSIRNEPRGLFCAVGRCTDCIMTVDGEPNIRTCVTLIKEGMKVETQKGLGKWQRNV